MTEKKKKEKEMITLYHITFAIYDSKEELLPPKVYELLCQKRPQSFKVEKRANRAGYYGSIISNQQLNKIQVDDMYNGVLRFSGFCTEEGKEEMIAKMEIDLREKLNSLKEYSEKRLKQIDHIEKYEEFFIE